MGLFDSFKKRPALEFQSKEDAIVTLMVAIGSLDGELDQDEVNALIAMASINNSLANVSLEDAFRFAVKYIRSNGPEQSAVDAFGYLPDENHATALSFGCLVALADGVVTAEEEQTLMELAEISVLNEEEAQAVIHTSMAIMQQI